MDNNTYNGNSEEENKKNRFNGKEERSSETEREDRRPVGIPDWQTRQAFSETEKFGEIVHVMQVCRFPAITKEDAGDQIGQLRACRPNTLEEWIDAYWNGDLEGRRVTADRFEEISQKVMEQVQYYGKEATMQQVRMVVHMKLIDFSYAGYLHEKACLERLQALVAPYGCTAEYADNEIDHLYGADILIRNPEQKPVFSVQVKTLSYLQMLQRYGRIRRHCCLCERMKAGSEALHVPSGFAYLDPDGEKLVNPEIETAVKRAIRRDRLLSEKTSLEADDHTNNSQKIARLETAIARQPRLSCTVTDYVDEAEEILVRYLGHPLEPAESQPQASGHEANRPMPRPVESRGNALTDRIAQASDASAAAPKPHKKTRRAGRKNREKMEKRRQARI